ncbi:hypothetical protein D3C80_1858300 [compost metagenome]
MGDVVADAFDFIHQALDALQHRIDDGREHVQFIAAIGQRQAPGQVAGNNRLSAGLNRPDAPQRPTPQ